MPHLLPAGRYCLCLLGAQFSYSWDPAYLLEEEAKHGSQLLSAYSSVEPWSTE